jgi:soluble lytic murein transglycosylase
MPRVPSRDSFDVALSAGPNARFTAPQGPDAGTIAARQGAQMGQAVEQAGQAAGRIALDMQQEANRVRVIDAVTQAKERLFDLQYGQQGLVRAKGVEALQRPSGKLLADEYDDAFEAQVGEIEKSLGNDAQRQAFREQAGQMRVQLRGDAMRHTAQEFKTYQSATYDAAASAAKRQIALNYKDLADDGLVTQGVQTVTAAVKEKARLLGMPQTWADEQVIQEVSAAHRLAIKTALENDDIELAAGYLNKHKGSMTADDHLTVRSVIDKEMRTRVAVQVGSQVVGELAPKLQPSDMDRLVGITMQTESGGRRYGKDGQLLTSPKGARGEMQVMPGTQRDPGFGVTPARDDSPEELARVGRDYLRAMVKRYDGDPAKAWAAYNAGPGELDEALMRAKASRTPGASWLTFMPNETQAYVTKNMKMLEEGFGAPTAPTLMDVQAAVRHRLGDNADPLVVKAAVQHATQQWEVARKAIDERNEALVADAQRLLLANGGRFQDLPSSVRSALPPGKVDNLMTFAGKIAKGENVATDWSLYYRLASDPELLARTNLGVLRDRLAPAEFKQLTGQQADLSKGDDKRTHLLSAKGVIDQMMRENGIDPSPKDSDKNGAEKVGQLMAAYQDRISAREAQLGKKLGDKELREEAAALFRPVKTSGFLGFSSETPVGLVKPTDTVIVPDADRAAIERQLRAAGRPVTDAAIEALYRAHNRIPQRPNDRS